MKLTAYQLNAAALLCERWGHAAFKSADRVVVSTPHGSDWITLTPDLLEGLVSDIRAAAVESALPASASPKLVWRPIQTAPKDRRIVVWLESDRKGLVCWQEKVQRWLEYGMGFCDPLYWFDVPAPDLDDAGETHDTVLS